MSNLNGILYVVATPIGNLTDISQRALNILTTVDLIAAEDTRQTLKLLQVYGIKTPITSYHDHNEAEECHRLATLIANGAKLALVSDAGTPLVSDPGFRLVREARRLGLTVIPIPGPCALICALSAAGLPSDRFMFLGFPPKGAASREQLFQSVATEPGTLIFYEAGSRLQATIAILGNVLGKNRQAVLAREITKLYETFTAGTLESLAIAIQNDPLQIKGEHVLLVAGVGQNPPPDSTPATHILQVLLEELPIKQAVKLTARITGAARNDLYRTALIYQEHIS